MEAGDNKTGKLDWGHIGRVSRAAINGAIGDYLVEQKNPLAIEMGLYHQGAPVKFTGKEEGLTNKVVILLHGLTNLETVWDFPASADQPASAKKENYGTLLRADFGYTPFYLRYNSGLAIESNGRTFSRVMSAFIEQYPHDIDEIVLIGFSMGGLLMRYAQASALETNELWLSRVRQCIYIGSPHDGSYFERFAVWSSRAMRSVPKDYVNVWADWVDTRSTGIRDLKWGVEKGQEEVPHGFHEDARHHFISGSLKRGSGYWVDHCLGDSMVEKRSAHPEDAPAGSKFAHFEGIAHVPLAYSPVIYPQIKQWIEEANSPVELKRYPPLASASGMNPPSYDSQGLSLAEGVSGALSLAAFVYGRTLNTVERMHNSIAREPHQVLQKVPGVAQASTSVEAAQSAIASVVFDSVRKGEDLLREAARVVALTSGDKAH